MSSGSETEVEAEEEITSNMDDNQQTPDDKPNDDKTNSNPEIKYKFGIIYLSYIPDGLNVKILRDIMGQFGDVGRVYLEPEENNRKKYSEGWVEFKKKRVAKEVAKTLNGKPLQVGRKRSRINGQIWSIKYLHKFKWAHLTEQLAHDKAVRDQKRKFEMTQTKKLVDFYQRMTERSKLNKKRRLHEKNSSEEESDKLDRLKRRQNEPKAPSDTVDEDLLGSIFKKVVN